MQSVYAEIIEKRLQPGSESKRDILQSFIAHGLPRDELVLEVIFLLCVANRPTKSSLSHLINNRLTLSARTASPVPTPRPASSTWPCSASSPIYPRSRG